MSEKEGLLPLDELARGTGKYPVDAFHFVQEGLKFTVQKLFQNTQEEKHIRGQELCWGLRDFALKRWGLLAPVVLRRWNICNTMDFGHIVFAMVDAGWMAKREEDCLDDFRDVFDFREAFNATLAMDMEKRDKANPEGC